jgi:hypothetical protein
MLRSTCTARSIMCAIEKWPGPKGPDFHNRGSRTRRSAVNPAMLPERQDVGRGSGRDAMHRVSTRTMTSHKKYCVTSVIDTIFFSRHLFNIFL